MKKHHKNDPLDTWPFHELVENFSYGVMFVRAKDDLIVYTNPALDCIFGFDAGELIGKPFGIIQSLTKSNPDEIFRVASEGKQWQGDLNSAKKDGARFWCRMTVFMIRNSEHGDIWVSTYQDISQQKQVEQTLAQIDARYAHTLDNMREGCQIIDFDWRYVYLNDSAVRQGHNTREALLQQTMMEMYPGIENTYMFSVLRDCMVNRVARKMENRFTYPNGEEGWFELSIQPVPEGIFILSMDITERKKIELALQESEERFARVFLEGPVGISITSLADSKIIEVNDSFLRIFEFTRDEVLGHTSIDLNILTPDSRAKMMQVFLEKGRLREYEVSAQTKNGRTIHCLLSVEMIQFAAGPHLITSMIDVTVLKQVEEQFKEYNQKLELLFEILPVGVSVLNRERKLVKQNAALGEILGISRERLARGDYRNKMYLRPDGTVMPDDEFASVRVLRGEPAALNVETGIVREDGSVIWVNVSAIAGPFTDWNTIIVTSDITERRKAELELQKANSQLKVQLEEIQSLQATLREQAIRDSLTGLFNRRYLDETIERELARAKREHYPVSVLMLDVDHFKDFNDQYGHKVGDEVLIRLGKLLHECIRQEDIACRYGGDEFALILPGAHIEDSRHRAEQIRRLFANMRINIDGLELSANISVGVSIYPQHGMNGDQIIRFADTALYTAKQAGRNCVFVWQQT